MALSRLVLSLLLLVALVVAVVRPKCSEAPLSVQAPCNATSLSAPFTGPLRVSSVQNYGCEGPWAFLWATIGSGQTAVGVTEVLKFDETSQEWRVASRQKVCAVTILPHDVYQQGCFSN
jgi:hypothetical protein